MSNFNGTGVVVWLADCKLKWRAVHDQDKFKEVIAKLKEKVSPACIATFVINWSEEEVLFISGSETEE